jgi:hypothetical protein
MRTALCCLPLAIILQQAVTLLAADTATVRPTAVVLNFEQGKVRYNVDAKPLRSDEILEVLGRIKDQKGGRTSVVVLVDQRNSLATLSNIRGIIDKAGFSNVRYFSFTVDRQMMEEIPIGQRRAIPFSLNP